MLATNQRGNQSYIWGMCWHAIWERSNADGILDWSAAMQRSNNGKQLDDINLGNAMSGWLWNAINGRVASNLVTCLNFNMARVGNAIEGSQHVMPWKASAGRHRGWQAHSFLGACLEVVSTGSLPSLAALGRTLGSPWPICAGGSFGSIAGL